jgi:hypothetical protein
VKTIASELTEGSTEPLRKQGSATPERVNPKGLILASILLASSYDDVAIISNVFDGISLFDLEGICNFWWECES